MEIGVLSDTHRNYSTKHLYKVDFTDNYDHKDQPLSIENSDDGLSQMSADIAKAVFRKLANNQTLYSLETFRSLEASCYRIALDFIETYTNDSPINGLKVDRDAEKQAVEMVAKNIMQAGERFLADPMETPFIRN